MRLRMLAAAIAALSLAGCVAMRSTPFDVGSSRIGNGIQYAMPKGMLRIQLIMRDQDLYLEVSEPFIVGDPNATYLLESSSGLLSNQEYRVVVDPQTRLLIYVNSSSEGQAGQIIQNAVRSAAYLSGAPSLRAPISGERLMFSRIVDPFLLPGCDLGTVCDFQSVNRDLRNAALAACDAPEVRVSDRACARVRANEQFFRIELRPLFTVTRNEETPRRSTPNRCRRSICYRAPLPYSLAVNVGGVTDVSENVSLPNEAPVMSAEVPAGIFATSRARVELYQGMPARYVVDRDNELVAIALLPFEVVNAGFTALSNVVQLRVNYRSRLEQEEAGRIAPTRPAGEMLPEDGNDAVYGDADLAGEANDSGTPARLAVPLPWSDPDTVVTLSTQGNANSADVLFSIPLTTYGADVQAPESNPVPPGQ